MRGLLIPSSDRAGMVDFFAAQQVRYAASTEYSATAASIRDRFSAQVNCYPGLADGFVYDGHLKNYLDNRLPIPNPVLRESLLNERTRSFLMQPRISNIGIYRVNDKVGYGVFALEDMPRNSLVGIYHGLETDLTRVHDSRYAVASPIPPEFHYDRGWLGALKYVFQDPLDIAIDAREFGNEMRFMNHADSAFAVKLPDGRITWPDNTNGQFVFFRGVVHFVLFTTRDVLAGEELRWNYGKSYVNFYFGGQPDRSAVFLRGAELINLETLENQKDLNMEKAGDGNLVDG